MLLMIDNYDSFTYNLVAYFNRLKVPTAVYRHDAITLPEIETMAPRYIVISPGPCTPNEAGISLMIIQQLGHRFPILGVCLGHQCIGQAFGATIILAKTVMHGKTSEIYHDSTGLFHNLRNPFTATRYHSLVIDPSTLPSELLAYGFTHDDHEIMAIRHRTLPIYGIQFHPESILTPDGITILNNFVTIHPKNLE